MSDPRTGELLWELPRAASADDGAPPDDAVLIAYRARALPPAEEVRVEWELTRSRRGRARLAELAGVRLEAPPRSSPWGAARLAAASLLAASLVLAVWVGTRPSPLPEFTVRVEALAATRSAPGGARALPDRPVRIVVEPRGDAVDGVTFAAYRLEDGALARVASPDLAVEVHRGSAVLVARADRLVGEASGTRPFFVVATRRSILPDRLDTGGDPPDAALRRSTGGHVYPVSLSIVGGDPR